MLKLETLAIISTISFPVILLWAATPTKPPLICCRRNIFYSLWLIRPHNLWPGQQKSGLAFLTGSAETWLSISVLATFPLSWSRTLSRVPVDPVTFIQIRYSISIVQTMSIFVIGKDKLGTLIHLAVRIWSSQSWIFLQLLCLMIVTR